MADEQKPSDEAPSPEAASPQASSPEAPSPEAPSPREVNPRTNVWIVVAIVAVTLVFMGLSRRWSTSRHEQRPSSLTDGGVSLPEATEGSPTLAILAPLHAGSPLGDGQVESISTVNDGRILVQLRRGQSEATYGIMLAPSDPGRLLRAGRYVLYVHGTNNPAFGGMAMALLAVLNRHQSEPVPAGLRRLEL